MQIIGTGALNYEQTIIAKALDVREEDRVVMNRRLECRNYRLNHLVSEDSDWERRDRLVDETKSQAIPSAERQELDDHRLLLVGAWKTLNERRHHILAERRLKQNSATLEELAQQCRISSERVGEIEAGALGMLHKGMTRYRCRELSFAGHRQFAAAQMVTTTHE